MSRKVTIQDIADALGISRNTVSKAINNSEGIADSTRDKILEKAVEMGYKQFSYVNTLANIAPSSKDQDIQPAGYKGEIALFSSMFLNQSHFASTMLDKFQREISQLGYTLNTHRVTADNLKNLTLPVTFVPENCRAIMCIEIFDWNYSEMVCSLDLPVLFIDGPVKSDGRSVPADQLYMDNCDEVTRFVREMLGRGYSRIGFIGDYEHCQSFYERYCAYRCAMFSSGAEVLERDIIKAQDVPLLTEYLSKLKSYPDVFICANDFIAYDAVMILKGMGVRIPEDVMFCGFDDSPESRMMVPQLTTVHIHTQIMAYTAAELLLSRMKEPSLDYRIVHTKTDLIWRESSGEIQVNHEPEGSL